MPLMLYRDVTTAHQPKPPHYVARDSWGGLIPTMISGFGLSWGIERFVEVVI